MISNYADKERNERLRDILRTFNRYRLSDWFDKIPLKNFRQSIETKKTKAIREEPIGTRLYKALTELGPTFIKLGQVLSTRGDLIGPEIASELQKLQSETPADSPDVVKKTIKDEFGAEPGELFEVFEEQAFSSASIGQVHRAQLSGGQDVVVKIQHGGIQRTVLLDLEILENLAAILEKHVSESKRHQPVANIREFRRTMLKELDFRVERRNMEQFRRNFSGDETLHIPVVYEDHCSTKVLTMEFLDGIPGSKPDKLAESEIDMNTFAIDSANVFVNMILRDGFYHADPHPGNMMLLENGVLGLMDCGMVGSVDDTTRENFEELLIRLLQKDSEGLVDLILRLGSAPRDIDRSGFQADVESVVDEFWSSSLDEMNMGAVIEQLVYIFTNYEIHVPPRIILVFKTLGLLEGTARLLSPTFSLAELLEPYKVRLIEERLNPRRLLKKLLKPISSIDRIVTVGPKVVADVVDRLSTESLTMKHEVPKIEMITNRLVAGILIATLFVGSSLLLSFKVPPVVSGISIIGAVGALISVILGGKILAVVLKELK